MSQLRKKIKQEENNYNKQDDFIDDENSEGDELLNGLYNNQDDQEQEGKKRRIQKKSIKQESSRPKQQQQQRLKQQNKQKQVKNRSERFDDEEEELDESEDDRRKQGIRQFLDESAEEDSEEEFEEEEDEPYHPKNKNEKNELQKLQNEMDQKFGQRKKQPDFMRMESEQEIKEYFGSEDDRSVDENEEDYDDGDQKRANLPNMNDPKLFAVKCKQGFEKESVFCIMNKFMALMGTKDELQIFSANFIEKFPGYIYVEAHKEVHVREAIKNLYGFEFSKGAKIEIIPIKEVPQVFTKNLSNIKDIERGQFVRVKKGLYKDDLAKVLEYDDIKQYVKLQLVPRLSLDNEPAYDDENEDENNQNQPKIQSKNKQQQRPPQKLYQKDIIRNRKKDEEFQNLKFDNGFLIKNFSLKNIEVENVVPTIDELQVFIAVKLAKLPKDEDQEDQDENEDEIQNKEEILEKACEIIQRHKSQINCFEKGDLVRVIDGDLQNLIGVVVNTNKQEVIILPKMENITEQMSMHCSQLVKHFKEGDNVVVVNDKFKGMHGKIIRINGFVAHLIVSSVQNHIQVPVNYLKMGTETSADFKHTQLKKFDLVKLIGGERAGVILGLDRDSVSVIDDKGNVQQLSYFKIENVINDKKSFIHNNFKHKIGLDYTVKVLDGLNKGKTGTVKHIYQNQLFLYNIDFMQFTSGIFVESARNCYLLSNNMNAKPNYISAPVPNKYAKDQNNQQNKEQQAQNQQAPENKQQNQQRGKDPLIGKMIVVKKGQFKGFEGRIKDADERIIRLELLSRNKVVNVLRTDINLGPSNESQDGSSSKQTGSKTPLAYGGRTSYNPMSPFTMQSPGYNGTINSPNWTASSPAYQQNLK